MNDTTRSKINSCIVLVANCNVSALDDLASLVSARMMSVALSVVKNRALAEDVVQEAFIRIVKYASRFRADTNGYAWICKIVQNVALNALKRERKKPTCNIDDCFDLADPSDMESSACASAVLQAAMKTLSQVERQVVYQKYFMEQTVRDIAKNLSMSKSSVQRAITSAEEKLKNYLQSGTNQSF